MQRLEVSAAVRYIYIYIYIYMTLGGKGFFCLKYINKTKYSRAPVSTD
jgi:hypothetical protein